MAEATAELVDNAIDARMGHRVRVEIDYDARSGCISIQDDGCGMSKRELADALVLGRSSKRDAEIGKFGLGMKAACTGLGQKFSVVTAQTDRKFAWIAEYDAESFEEMGEWRMPIFRRTKQWKRGTRIEIVSSRIYPTLSASLHRHLGSTFRHFIEAGELEVVVNGERVMSQSYPVDPSSVLPLETSIDGRNVRGWVGLLRESSQRGWYGFALVRNRRIMKQYEKIGFNPHPSTARVVGELHLDKFETNNLKTDFIRETESWRELEEWITEAAGPVLAASRALAHGGTFGSSIAAKIAEERERILELIPEPELRLPGAEENSDGCERRQGSASSQVVLLLGETPFEHVFVTRGNPDLPYETEERTRPDGHAAIVVRSNIDDDLAQGQKDLGLWGAYNLAEIAAVATAERGDFVLRKGEILRRIRANRDLMQALRDSVREIAPRSSSRSDRGSSTGSLVASA